MFFNMYTYPLPNIINNHELFYHMYADDTQIYVGFNPRSESECKDTLQKIKNCLNDVKRWMDMNKLKLNTDKTAMMIIGTKSVANKNLLHSMKLDDVSVEPSTYVKNLGVVFDGGLTMAKHVNSLSKSLNFYFRNLWRVRKYFDYESAKTVVHALISSRLDYGNGLCFGIQKRLLNKLQGLQNTAARIVTRSSKRCHIMPILQKLHWLPLVCRINYKLLVFVHRALYEKCPEYLSDLLHPYSPGRSLRSTNDGQLAVPRTRLATFGDRSFEVCAPKLWNALPHYIRNNRSLESFTRLLKAHLFKQFYKK